MFLVYEEILAKKARRLHTLVPRATKPYLNKFKLLPKAYVKTAHAVCESTKLLRHGAISRYSRWKIGRFGIESHRLIMTIKSLIIKSLLQI